MLKSLKIQGSPIFPMVGVLTDHLNPCCDYPNFTILALRCLVKDWLVIEWLVLTPTTGQAQGPGEPQVIQFL